MSWSTTVSSTRPATSWTSCAPSLGGSWHERAQRPLPFQVDPHPQRKYVSLISPRIDKLLEHVDSDYASVIVAAKRARQINSYYHNLGEGTFDEFPPPMVDTRSKNYLTIALEEVAQGKLKYHYR